MKTNPPRWRLWPSSLHGMETRAGRGQLQAGVMEARSSMLGEERSAVLSTISNLTLASPIHE